MYYTFIQSNGLYHIESISTMKKIYYLLTVMEILCYPFIVSVAFSKTIVSEKNSVVTQTQTQA